MLVGTDALRNLIGFARRTCGSFPGVPWAVPLTCGVDRWFNWRYLKGAGPPEETRELRRTSLRANRVTGAGWAWSLLAGGLGIVALVLALRLANRLVVLPEQNLPNLAHVPKFMVIMLLLPAGRAGCWHHRRSRLSRLHAGTDRTPQWPGNRDPGHVNDVCRGSSGFYFVPLALLHGRPAAISRHGDLSDELNSARRSATQLRESIFQHRTLRLHGQAEWQATSASGGLIWKTGADASFWGTSLALVIAMTATAWAYIRCLHAAII